LKTLDETNVYVNVTTYLKVNIENLGWEECLCKCYISESKYWKPFGWDECLCECHISQRKHEKTWVRWKSMWMLHISKQILNTLSVMNVCECYISQSKYWKPWMRRMFMWMLHISKQILNTLSAINVYVNVSYLKANIENLGWDECLCECYISQSKYWKLWMRRMFMQNVTYLKVNIEIGRFWLVGIPE
jgi:hypothetical protein